MSALYYYDNNGRRQGPVSKEELKERAAQGLIRPDTPMETAAGQKGIASQISGLFDASPFVQMNFYYFDRTGQRQGPVSRLALEELAVQGII